MMRRARWLAAGAVLGALGYQRLHRATTSLTSQSDRVPAVRQAAPQALGVFRFAAGAAGHTAGAAGWLARQVRRRRAARRRPAGGVAGFVHDVREGIDDYLDRHRENIDRQHGRSGNTLVAQRATDQDGDSW